MPSERQSLPFPSWKEEEEKGGLTRKPVPVQLQGLSSQSGCPSRSVSLASLTIPPARLALSMKPVSQLRSHVPASRSVMRELGAVDVGVVPFEGRPSG